MNTIAIAKVTIEYETSQPWDNKCTVEQVFNQAKNESILKIQKAIDSLKGSRIKITGEPKITMVLCEEMNHANKE